MIELLRDIVYKINTMVGVECILAADGSMLLNACIVQLEKKNISMKTSIAGITTIEDLSKKLPAGINIHLAISGKGILTKQYDGVRVKSANELFPHLSLHEFYYREDYELTSIARRETVNKLLDRFTEAGMNVIDLSLGPGTVFTILNFLEEPKEIDTPVYKLIIDGKKKLAILENKEVEVYNYFEQKEYRAGRQYLKSSEIIPFSAATETMAASTVENSALPESVNIQRNQFAEKRRFYFTAILILAVVFAILLMNFFIFNYYFGKNKELTLTQTVSQTEITALKEKQKQLMETNTLLERLGWKQKSRSSYFADRIASFLPTGITLTSMQCQPLSNASAGQREVSFKRDTILLTGSSFDLLSLNQFSNNLKTLPEIKDVQLKSYVFQKIEDNGKFIMEIITD